MKLTIEGTPQEIAAFLSFRVEPVADVAAPPLNNQAQAQTIVPTAIERLEFGLDQAGATLDVAAINLRIGELMRCPGFQRLAAASMPAVDAFEPPMLHAKRFLMTACVRDNHFDLAEFDRFYDNHTLEIRTITSAVTFEGDPQ